jgi:integrase
LKSSARSSPPWRWCGLRVSDAAKLNITEVVPNRSGDGWNLSFIQKKTRDRCVVPLPLHVKAQLDALPGRIQGGKKYFVTCQGALRIRVVALSERAQAEIPFANHFSPHCLRHTFAIQHFNEGTPVQLVSKWLGHKNVAVTIKHYQTWIASSELIAEEACRAANAKMMAKSAGIAIAVPNE